MPAEQQPGNRDDRDTDNDRLLGHVFRISAMREIADQINTACDDHDGKDKK